MFAPASLWVFMMSHSSGVSLPGLFKMLSLMDILPMSCSAEALAMRGIRGWMALYWSEMRQSWASSIFVMERMFSTCIPLSPLRNSTMWLSTSTMIRLLFSLSSIWLVTMFSSIFCLEYSKTVLPTRRCTALGSKGRLMYSVAPRS